MKRILLLTVLLVCLFINSALAMTIMPIFHGDASSVSNSIVMVMSKQYPECYLENQTNNSLIFQGMYKNFFENRRVKFMFTFSPYATPEGTPCLRVVMQAYDIDYRGRITPNDSADLGWILLDVKSILDGYYWYGFGSKRTKIVEVNPNSPAYEAGLRQGDVITSVTFDGKTHKMTESLLMRTICLNQVIFTTKEGKSIPIQGIYVSPEQALQELLKE